MGIIKTINTAQNKTFKEINNNHTMICIEEVNAIKIVKSLCLGDIHTVNFIINGSAYSSDELATEEEAIKFRNEIMGWNNGK